MSKDSMMRLFLRFPRTVNVMLAARINQRAFTDSLTALLALFVFAAAPPALAQCPPVFPPQNFDSMRAPLLPTGVVASQGVNVTGAPLWVTSNVMPHTAPNDLFSTAPDNLLDNRLDLTVYASPFDHTVFFLNNYNLESGRDGAVLEVSVPSINGGAFTDITDPAVGGAIGPGYNSTISTAFQSPIGGRMAWSGNSGGYVFTSVYLGNAAFLPPLPGTAILRFRLVSDNSGSSEGWRLDSFSFLHSECSSPTPTATASPTATATATPIATPCGSPNAISDSSFEAGTPWPNWTVQTSTIFGTPLCNTAACGTGEGTAPPYAGDNWAWFGGANVAETATLGQSVLIMAGGQATLSFVLRIGRVSSPFTDVLNVRVDGTIVQSYPETLGQGGYSPRTIDLSAFADGASHSILFEYIGPTTSPSNYVVDNVILTTGPACSSPTPTPTVTPTATPTATATATPTPTPTATATPTPTPSSTPARALNISTRLRVETGERVMIGGFIITPSAGSGPGGPPKQVLLRGIGPSLSGIGVPNPLADPVLELHGPPGFPTIINDNWRDTQIPCKGTGLPPINDLESAICATLNPGAYTAIIRGKNNGSGVGLVEVYDLDQAAASKLANISTRGFVQTGENVMIGGFILGGSSNNTRIVVRGIGPSLAQFGVSNVLADPTLELRDSNGMLLLANDNWQDDPISQLAAFGLAPSNPLESGIFASLPPGAYTAILAGKNGGTGIGLVEIYNVQ